MTDETFDRMDTLSGAFIFVSKLEKNVISTMCWIKLNEIKFIEEDNRFEENEGTLIKTYKDTSYYCLFPERELIKLINMFIFKPEDYYEAYGF